MHRRGAVAELGGADREMIFAVGPRPSCASERCSVGGTAPCIEIAIPCPVSHSLTLRRLDAVAAFQCGLDQIQALVQSIAAKFGVGDPRAVGDHLIARLNHVDPPKFEWIHLEAARELVHRGFDRKYRLRHSVTADRAAGNHVGVNCKAVDLSCSGSCKPPPPRRRTRTTSRRRDCRRRRCLKRRASGTRSEFRRCFAPILRCTFIGCRVVAAMNSSSRVNSSLTGRPVLSVANAQMSSVKTSCLPPKPPPTRSQKTLTVAGSRSKMKQSFCLVMCGVWLLVRTLSRWFSSSQVIEQCVSRCACCTRWVA